MRDKKAGSAGCILFQPRNVIEDTFILLMLLKLGQVQCQNLAYLRFQDFTSS